MARKHVTCCVPLSITFRDSVLSIVSALRLKPSRCRGVYESASWQAWFRDVFDMSMKKTAFPDVSMDEETLQRLQVIGMVRWLEDSGRTRAQAVKEVCRKPMRQLDGAQRCLKPRTVYRWLQRHADHGVAGLRSKPRSRQVDSAVLEPELVAFIKDQKTTDPAASIPEVIRRARQRDVIAAAQSVDRTTVWRLCKQLDLPTRLRPSKHEGDMRAFAHAHRMTCILCDGKHFRAGAERLRRVALVFIDDASRYVPYGIVGTSENKWLFLRALYECVGIAGFADIYFLDGGPGFIAHDTERVILSFDFGHLIHGTAGYPEGHGKVERFNQTLQNDLLRGWDGAADVDPDCTALTLRLQHYLHNVYNVRPHKGIANQTPLQRWTKDKRALRFPADRSALRQKFILGDSYKVSNHHVITIGKDHYEAPLGTARKTVTVYRNALTSEVHVLHQGELVTLQPVDLSRNAIDRRAKRREEAKQSNAMPPKTAANMAFDRDCAPLVGPDGGFRESDDAAVQGDKE